MGSDQLAELDRPSLAPAPTSAMTAEALLELHNVRREYGATIAVEGLTLSLFPGRVHALVGENGAGKSTAALMAAGVVLPTSGSVVLEGQEIAFRSAREAEERGVVLIPQELRLYEALSVAENMYAGRPRPRFGWGGVRPQEMRTRAGEALRRLGSDIDPTDRVENLTPANRQMVAIARALMIDVRALIMDEPTAALDEWEAQRLLEVVDRLRAADVAVLYVSHRMHEVAQIADHVTVMRDGKAVASDLPPDVEAGELVRLMVGRQVSLIQRTKSRVTEEVVLSANALCRAGEFEDITLSVRAGEVVGLAGIVGSGRSEFAQSLFGFTTPTSGRVRISGVPVRPRSVAQMIRAGVGYVPEERQTQGLFGPLSVAYNVSLTTLSRARRRGMIVRRQERRQVQDALEPLHLRGRLSDPVEGLSGGNQQKVLLARWLAVDPRVMVLDEPTRGIDIGTRAEIYRLVDQLTERGVAVLLISSDLQELLLLSDRILVMRRGRLVAEFDAGEMSEMSVGGAALGLEAAVESIVPPDPTTNTPPDPPSDAAQRQPTAGQDPA